MNIEPLYYQYNPWWEGKYKLDSFIKREQILTALYPLTGFPDIIMLTGLRRVGKTITMKYLVQYLIEQKAVMPQHCFYISMDDYQLRNLSLIDVIDQYRQIMKISVKQKIYVFFDEITYIEDFQIQLKNIYDKGNVKCFVSSSSSSVLKDDSALLTGRKRIIEINPLDFNEYLTFKHIHISKADERLRETYFLEYMQTGGMPEYVLRGSREYMVNLIDDIIMKDIVAYHGIRNPAVVRDFFILLMAHAGKQISINRLATVLNLSPDTAKRYLSLFEQAYLIHLVPRYEKRKETSLSAKKVYATDIGMRNITVGFNDKEAIFENIVFMKIKRSHPAYVYTEGQELDFLIDDTLLEVKYHSALAGKPLDAFNSFQVKNKYVIKNCFDLQQLEDTDRSHYR